jgi:hypothetical protein
METIRGAYRQSDELSLGPRLEYTRTICVRRARPCRYGPETLLSPARPPLQAQASDGILSFPASLLEAREAGIEFDKMLLRYFLIANTWAGTRMSGGLGGMKRSCEEYLQQPSWRNMPKRARQLAAPSGKITREKNLYVPSFHEAK